MDRRPTVGSCATNTLFRSGSKRASVKRACSGGPRSVILSQLSVALIAVNAYGQNAFLSSPQELLARTPAPLPSGWKANGPNRCQPSKRRASSSILPDQGEVKRLNLSVEPKAGQSGAGCFRAAERDSAYEIKVVDVPKQGSFYHERTAILMISANSADPAGGQGAPGAGGARNRPRIHLGVDYARASARNDRRRLKDLELLCDAIAIVTLHGLNLDPSRLVTGLEKINRYNWNFFEAEVERRSYPSLSERRRFAREVTAWVSRASTPGSSR